MLPEVFECPQCERQFVFELVESSDDRSIYCPQCKRYLGEKDINFVLITEIEELVSCARVCVVPAPLPAPSARPIAGEPSASPPSAASSAHIRRL